jgi:hypothetical protein
MLNRLTLLTSTIGFTLLPFVATAIATPAGFTTHKDAKGSVYVGGTANSELIVVIGGVAKTKNLTANACGVAVFKGSLTSPIPTTFSIGSNTITPATLPTLLLPRCLTTGQLEEARPSNFKTADGAVVIVGQPASAQVVANYEAADNKKVKINACGFGKINNSSTKPFSANSTFLPTGATTALSYNSLPSQAPWLCKDNVTYRPVI